MSPSGAVNSVRSRCRNLGAIASAWRVPAQVSYIRRPARATELQNGNTSPGSHGHSTSGERWKLALTRSATSVWL